MKSFFTYKVLLLFFAVWFMAGCGNRKLLQAEQFMETDAKAADSILSSMPLPKSCRDRALYAVLKTQADYKLYRDIKSDSLIKTATDYYGTSIRGSHARRYHSALAWYSQGCVYSEMGNDIAAIDAYLKAKDLFPDTLIRYYALTEQNLGRHYLNRLMLLEATEQFKCCLENAKRLDDKITQRNAIYNLGCCALYNKDFFEADSIFNLILTDSTFSKDQKSIAMFQLSKIKLHHEKDFSEAMDLVNGYLNYHSNMKNNGAGLSVKADIFHEMGIIDSAYFYYGKSLEYSKDLNTLCSGYDHLTLMAIELGYKKDAALYYNDFKIMADSIYERRNHEQINIIESEHRTELAENQLHDRTIRFTIISAAFILLSVLLTFIAIIYYRNWKKEKIWRLRESINQTESEILHKKMDDSDQNLKKGTNQNESNNLIEMVELYRKELNECCQLFRLQDINSLMFSKTAIRDVELTKEEKIQIIKTLNDCFRPVMQFLSNEIPDINRDEAYVCILSYLGFNSVQISRLFDVTDACIRQRRKRAQTKDTTNLTHLFFTEKA